MHISVISLPVENLDRAIEFYTVKLGWEKTMDVPMGEKGRWVTVAPSETATSFTLSTHTMEGEKTKPGGSSCVIMECDDVFATSEKLRGKGVELTDEPKMEPWGGWAMFKDSEGNEHGLHSPPKR